MLVALFGGLFTAIAALGGVTKALAIYGLVAGLVSFIYIAVSLLTEGD